VLVLVCVCLSFHVIARTILPNHLSSYLYLRLWLAVPASIADAKLTSFLFDGSLRGKWYALTDLRKQPRDSRRQALLDFAQSIRSDESASGGACRGKCMGGVLNSPALNWVLLLILVGCSCAGWLRL
jgi:hypothetical protein